MITHSNAGFFRGEDVTLEVTMSPVVSISGWTLIFVMRREHRDNTAIITKTTGSGITITNAPGGVFEVALGSADTLNLEPRTYVFDIQRSNSGSRAVIVIGTMQVGEQVSLAV